jgi:hypothetical protein
MASILVKEINKFYHPIFRAENLGLPAISDSILFTLRSLLKSRVYKIQEKG